MAGSFPGQNWEKNSESTKIPFYCIRQNCTTLAYFQYVGSSPSWPTSYLMTVTVRVQESFVVNSYPTDNIHDIMLVRQIHDLKSAHNTNFLHQCLSSPDSAHAIVNVAKCTLLSLEWSLKATSHSSLSCISSRSMEDSWGNFWNSALDHGPSGTKIAQSAYRILTRPKARVFKIDAAIRNAFPKCVCGATPCKN